MWTLLSWIGTVSLKSIEIPSSKLQNYRFWKVNVKTANQALPETQPRKQSYSCATGCLSSWWTISIHVNIRYTQRLTKPFYLLGIHGKLSRCKRASKRSTNVSSRPCHSIRCSSGSNPRFSNTVLASPDAINSPISDAAQHSESRHVMDKWYRGSATTKFVTSIPSKC